MSYLGNDSTFSSTPQLAIGHREPTVLVARAMRAHESQEGCKQTPTCVPDSTPDSRCDLRLDHVVARISSAPAVRLGGQHG
mmetsp:Transcript_22381/g.57513  ORF Transcript_22381/g.57513 Transcript_22381/m.57513 type:complete len:81 (-) Transcript_22381:418-660(-)